MNSNQLSALLLADIQILLVAADRGAVRLEPGVMGHKLVSLHPEGGATPEEITEIILRNAAARGISVSADQRRGWWPWASPLRTAAD